MHRWEYSWSFVVSICVSSFSFYNSNTYSYTLETEWLVFLLFTCFWNVLFFGNLMTYNLSNITDTSMEAKIASEWMTQCEFSNHYFEG